MFKTFALYKILLNCLGCSTLTHSTFKSAHEKRRKKILPDEYTNQPIVCVFLDTLYYIIMCDEVTPI